MLTAAMISDYFLVHMFFLSVLSTQYYTLDISSCGVVVFLKALYLVGPLRCVMYTTPLSTLTSSLSLNHHLYADDTQLFSPSILATLTQVSPTSRLL